MRSLLHSLARWKLISPLVGWTKELKYLPRSIVYCFLDNAFWAWCIAVSIFMACIVVNYWDEMFVCGEPDVTATIRNIAIVWGGLVGIGLAAWRSKIAERQAEVSRSRLLDERYQNAVALLDNNNTHIRIGAIHAIRNLAYEDYKAFAPVVGTVLKSMKEHKDREHIVTEQELKEERDTEYLVLKQAIQDVNFVQMLSDDRLYDRAIESRRRRATGLTEKLLRNRRQQSE